MGLTAIGSPLLLHWRSPEGSFVDLGEGRMDRGVRVVIREGERESDWSGERASQERQIRGLAGVVGRRSPVSKQGRGTTKA